VEGVFFCGCNLYYLPYAIVGVYFGQRRDFYILICNQTSKKVQSTSGVDCILLLFLIDPNLANFLNKKYVMTTWQTFSKIKKM
jgi:hypothetical protein